MNVVVDASVVLGLALPDESVPTSLAAQLRDTTPRAPALLPYEVANGVASAVRRERLSPAEAHRVLTLIAALGIGLEPAPEMVALSALAGQTGLSAYDAAYLELAMRLGCPLVTADARLAEVARAAGVDVRSA